ncbi:hypothetical protein GCM10007304_17850 [Rhodococcoides trifolii]|uniref:DUF2637 domain-containing protein n=1 Tax=Rhodococcoides trifolii TaxID=908250 RepID=A0A917FVD0_9NOCA|nr:DUF2637 domain-containing protein [Rhodococcus trifolii]GGG04149.1 hypothetical protein GCM10007304_17850 [Rhodococcus trifolii]
MIRRTAVATTTLIGALAFFLSFSQVSNLAARGGYGHWQSLAWPVIVDGLVVVAELAVFTTVSGRVYAWVVLIGATGVSGAANIAHAYVTPTELPFAVTGPMAAVPSIVLLVATHLTVKLTRTQPPAPAPTAGGLLTAALTRPRAGADWAITGAQP